MTRKKIFDVPLFEKAKKNALDLAAAKSKFKGWECHEVYSIVQELSIFSLKILKCKTINPHQNMGPHKKKNGEDECRHHRCGSCEMVP
jgi:hypothetical protein